jgi:hypothetical protein
MVTTLQLKKTINSTKFTIKTLKITAKKNKYILVVSRSFFVRQQKSPNRTGVLTNGTQIKTTN